MIGIYIHIMERGIKGVRLIQYIAGWTQIGVSGIVGVTQVLVGE